jgi:1-deoxy-D-xylulose-5-phosphate reductoisomerase
VDNGTVTPIVPLSSLDSGPRRVIVLGSTGSVGTQALQVIEANPDRFVVVGLAAGGSRPDLLARQAAGHPEARVAVPGRSVPDGIARRRVLTGPGSAVDLVIGTPADVVLNAITGSIGLAPTLAALAAGTTLALANKESLVAGGSLVTAAAEPGQIVPVDSEHSAIAQCLRAGDPDEVARLVITASGGPFRGRNAEQLEDVTVADALAHPTWDMGPVVTINSATLVNKGLEVIEAHLLFGLSYSKIDVVVHPQSVIHSMVTFCDGAIVAQASPPDMKLPIALGLSWPARLPGAATPCDFSSASSWTFEPVDRATFPALDIARAAGMAGGLVPAAFNAANEQAVAAFTSGTLTFPGIFEVLDRIVDEADDLRTEPSGVQDVLDAEAWARTRADEMIERTVGARR